MCTVVRKISHSNHNNLPSVSEENHEFLHTTVQSEAAHMCPGGSEIGGHYYISVRDVVQSENLRGPVHTVAIWAFTFHEKSGCV